jgi:hypothetical protein
MDFARQGLWYYLMKSSRGATISPDAERALAPHRFDLRAGRTLGDTAIACAARSGCAA